MESDASGVKVIVTVSIADAGFVIATVYATDGTAAAPGNNVQATQRMATTKRVRVFRSMCDGVRRARGIP